jgi:hypothetical protein
MTGQFGYLGDHFCWTVAATDRAVMLCFLRALFAGMGIDAFRSLSGRRGRR